MTERSPAAATPAGTPSPLASRLSAGAKEARERLTQRFRFGSGGFDALASTASDVSGRLTKAGAPDAVLGRVADHRRLFADVAKLINDAATQVVPPTNAEVYTAALETVQFDDITRDLLGTPWKPRVLGALTGMIDRSDQDAQSMWIRDRTMLLFAATCRRAQIRVSPSDQSSSAAVLDLNGWHVGVAVEVADGAAGLAPAVRRAGEAVKALGTPGLVLVEITDVLPDANRANRVDSDQTGLSEMQALVDKTLVDGRTDFALAANGDNAGAELAFGLVASATMRSTIVSAARVGFATLFRGVNLCELDDPRIEKLAWFLDRFASA